MKVEEVPQDNANLFEGKTRDVTYALDENGKYTTVKSVGWDPKNIAMLDAWEHENQKIEEARKLVLEGKKSPVFYYMRKTLMDVKILALYTGFSRFRVKRHFKPSVFSKLDDTVLDRYIDAFGLKNKQDLLNVKENED